MLNDAEIAKSKRDFELKKAAYDVEVQTKVSFIMSLSILPFEFEPGFGAANGSVFPCINNGFSGYELQHSLAFNPFSL